MYELCAKCQGRGFCGKSCRILNRIKELQPKIGLEFEGNSPPEIFVGKFSYPNVFVGILSPPTYTEQAEKLSMPELWASENASINEILQYRSQLIYGRFKNNVFNARKQNSWQNKRFEAMQEIAMASKPVATEFRLGKKPQLKAEFDNHVPIIGNPAPLEQARIQENPKIEKKVDYLANDSDAKANQGIRELYKSKIAVSNIIKILSAGLLGLKKQRKLVPTRWAVTATDDSISKEMLEKIKTYQEVSDILLFNSEYIGNHYEILLLPSEFQFEVIEAKMSGSVWNPQGTMYISQDYENFYGRKDYAEDVTGAYYANRLAVCEFLMKIRRQASCLFMRECRPEYWAPCGVGILRECSRHAFMERVEKFSTIKEALQSAQKRLRLNISTFSSKSRILQEYKKQQKLNRFF
ncbi:hypothetical protein COS75_00695 [Candidatus Pacearchaeota archaeon CG06_land_8_20_14_3_00_35_12]|nr:MAG: hypothetical protein COS75_00695 [Candidatus Pacearchaeota archaeon CG06_land_8_20_14_3_00_35_12]